MASQTKEFESRGDKGVCVVEGCCVEIRGEELERSEGGVGRE